MAFYNFRTILTVQRPRRLAGKGESELPQALKIKSERHVPQKTSDHRDSRCRDRLGKRSRRCRLMGLLWAASALIVGHGYLSAKPGGKMRYFCPTFGHLYLFAPHTRVPVYSVLDQRIHYGAVDLTEKFPGMLVTLANDYESVIVQDVAVQFFGSAIFLTTRATALKKTNGTTTMI